MKLFKKYRSKAALREKIIDMTEEYNEKCDDLYLANDKIKMLECKVATLSMVNIVPVHRVEQETVVIRQTLPFDDHSRMVPVDMLKGQIKHALALSLEPHISWDLFTDRSTGINYVSGTLHLAVRKE